MKIMVSWMEYDKKLKRDVEWQSYFEKQDQAIKFMNQQNEKGFKIVQFKSL